MKKFSVVLLTILFIFSSSSSFSLVPNKAPIVNIANSFAAKKALIVGVADYQLLLPACPKNLRAPECDLNGPIHDVPAIKKALLSYAFSFL